MHEKLKNLRLKEYNPCGGLTGRENSLCDEATTNYFNLPFVEVMRTLSIKALAELEHEKNFPNVAALKNWADYSLNDTERRANLNFDTFTRLQAGLSKYLVHLLYENRYNIHYNALLKYFCSLEDFSTALTSDELEKKIDSIAQHADYRATVNDLKIFL